MLTEKQHAALMFIHERITATGISPAYTEIAAHLGLKSKSGVAEIVKALVRRGFIRKMDECARSIEVIRPPQNAGNPLPDLLRDIVAHFAPELAGLRHDCADADGGATDASLLAFIETGEALLARAEAMVGGR